MVDRNDGSFDEGGYYSHCVIECIGPGIHAGCTTVKWYEFSGGVWRHIDAPSWSAGLCSFGIG